MRADLSPASPRLYDASTQKGFVGPKDMGLLCVANAHRRSVKKSCRTWLAQRIQGESNEARAIGSLGQRNNTDLAATAIAVASIAPVPGSTEAWMIGPASML